MNEERLKIKVCGMRDEANIAAVARLRPDFMGFIFYEGSSRYVGEGFDAALLRQLPPGVAPVALFVNAGYDTVISTCHRYGFRWVQLHGSEEALLCRKLSEEGIGVIKAFAVSGSSVFENIKPYMPWCSYLLFDTPAVRFGGSGESFDWSVLAGYKGDLPFLLAGGIGPANIDDALAGKVTGMAGVDINSRVERAPGLKDVAETELVINRVRGVYDEKS